MRILALILLLTTFAPSIDRPNMYWRIVSVKCDLTVGCDRNPDVLINARTLPEALKTFTQKYTDSEIRCITRDYFFSGCMER